MMKRFALLLALCLLLCGAALAEEYTDVPGAPTQDEVLSLEAAWQDAEQTPYALQTLVPDQLTVDTVTAAYKFVYEEKNRPVRFFPEETQRQIEALLAGRADPDALHMTELMRLHAPAAEPQTELLVKMLLDVDYQPGQLVAAVLGDTSDPEALVWTAVPAEVTALGLVEFTAPQDLMQALQNEDVIFSLLTIRPGRRGGVVTYREETIHVELPSKTAYDVTRIVKVTDENGDPLPHAFQLLVVDETPQIQEEMKRLRAHVKEQKKPAVAWLPPEDQISVQLLLGDALEKERLVVYDYLPLITIDYVDTYGDAVAAFTFATPYAPGQAVVTALGLPKEGAAEGETAMTWTVQRARVSAAGEVEIVFDQLSLSGMGEQTGLLLVLSQPLAE